MTRRRSWARIAVLSLLAAPLAAQEGVPRFDRLSVEEGLSHSTVRAIHQDARGFLWFGTQEGLNRYDGYRFSVYKHDPADPGSLAESEVMAVCGDRRGELWVGTWGGGLNRLAPDATGFVHYRHEPADPASLRHDVVTALLESGNGALWIGTEEGLDRFERGSETFSRVDLRPGDPETGTVLSVNHLAEDAAGGLWVATGEGLFRLDHENDALGRFAAAEACPGGTVWALAADPDGTLWAAASGGLLRLDPRDGSCRVYRHDPADPRTLGDTSIFSLHVDRTGELWVGTEAQGLGRFERRSDASATDSFTHSRHQALDPESLSDNGILSIFEDRTGILWIGTYGGINKYDRRRERFVTYRQRAGRGLASNSIWAIREDRDGALWVGHYDNGLDRVDRQRGSVTHYPPAPEDPAGLPHGTVSAIAEDPAGDLWIGTWGGLSKLDAGRRRFRTYRHDPADHESLSDDGISTLLLDSSGRLWVGTYSGLDRFDGPAGDGERFIHYPVAPGDPESLGETPIYAIHEGRDGALWFGSDTDGLYRLEPGPSEAGSSGFRRYRHDPTRRNSLSSDKIAAIHEDASGFLWVGTYSAGLNRLDRERRRFLHYREKDGLPNDTILGILEDDAGHLWLSTNLGLSRFDPRSETFRNYDVDDGLQGIVFSTGSAFESAGGEMFFGGINGINAFYPERIDDDPQPPEIVITDLLLSTRETPLQPALAAIRNGELVLTHRQYAFSLEFAALHYASPKKNRYAYRLEGFDRGWIETGADKRFAQYSNLDPGDYLFRVKGSNGDGAWNEEGVSLRVTVRPPPWKTWWAYGLYGLAAVAAIAGYTGWQQRKVERERTISRRLREVDRLKDQFLANTSHELRTPLFGIVGIVESLLDGATGALPEETRSNLGMVAASGRRLHRLVDDILDFSKLSRESLELHRLPVDLHTLTDVVLALSKPLADDKSLALKNAVDPDLPPAWGDESRVQQILHNLVGNAIKFTESGSVEVTAVAEEGRLAVRVADTGIGIAEDQTEGIFEVFEQADGTTERAYGGTGLGLAVTRQLVDLHGGSIWVESTPGQGSAFTFTLPLAPDGAVVAPPRAARPPARPVAPAAAGSPEPGPAAPGPSREAGRRTPDRRDGEEKYRILIVDDEPVVRRVLTNQLSVEEYRLTAAASGDEALALIEEEPFDLVLLDVMMPKMSGYEVCRVLRRHHPREDLPVIFLTAKHLVSDRVTGFAAGASDYLTKPIEKDELLARVRTHLELLAATRSLVQDRAWELEAKLAAEAASRAKSEFLANMSHELRTPLVGVIGFADLLRTSELEAEPLSFAEQIASSGDALLSIVDDLLDFSRIEAGQLAIEAKEVSLREVISAVLRLLEPRAQETGIGLGCEIEESLPDRIKTDAGRLRQVLVNLVGNAVKFTPEGGVNVRVSSVPPGRSHDSPSSEEGLRLRFAVKDTGIGIPREALPTLFDPFTQVDGSNTRKYGGTGLGLAISQRIVEKMGGMIGVESRLGRGSTFWIELPVEAAGEAAPETPEAEVEPISDRGLYRVLLVEDNRINRNYIATQIEAMGYRPTAAADGHDALAMLERQRFDLVLMDCQMPGLDGFEATRRLRRREGPEERVPVIAVTAHALAGDRRRCLDAGMDDYLAKPFRPHELRAIIRRWLPARPAAGRAG